MRDLLIIGLLIFSFIGCKAQNDKAIKNEKFGAFKIYPNDTILARQKEIVRTDSLIIPESGYLIYKSFDKNDTIVQELKYYQAQNNTKQGYLTQNIYNEQGKIILYELFNMEGLEIERYKFEYNNMELLTKKEGFGSGEIGITIKYYYSPTGKLIDKKAFRFGKEVTDYFKTMK
ncbi:MAG: hypothetical protein ACM3O3_10360 [Syntrophothermus sp.]